MPKTEGNGGAISTGTASSMIINTPVTPLGTPTPTKIVANTEWEQKKARGHDVNRGHGHVDGPIAWP